MVICVTVRKRAAMQEDVAVPVSAGGSRSKVIGPTQILRKKEKIFVAPKNWRPYPNMKMNTTHRLHQSETIVIDSCGYYIT